MHVVLKTALFFFAVCQAPANQIGEEARTNILLPDGDLIIRYQDEFSSPPFSLSHSLTRIVHLKKSRRYFGKLDYLFSFVNQREDIQKEIGLSSKQQSRLPALSKKINNLIRSQKRENENNKLPNTLSSERSTTDLASKIDYEVKSWLTKKQLERVEQLENHYLVARYGGEFIRIFPTMFSDHWISSKHQKLHSVDWKSLSKEIDSHKLVRLSGKLKFLKQWLDGVVSEENLESLHLKTFKNGLGYYPILEIYALDNLDEISAKIREAKDPMKLWEVTANTVVGPTGKFERRFSKDSGNGQSNLLGCLAFDLGYKDFFEMTSDQVTEARVELKKMLPKNGLANVSLDDLKPDKKCFENILLPFQLELMEQRKLWREAEVYGIVPAIFAGRLGEQMQITDSDRKVLKNRAKAIVQSFNELARESHAKQLELIRDAFASADSIDMYDRLFGKSVNKIVFRY